MSTHDCKACGQLYWVEDLCPGCGKRRERHARPEIICLCGSTRFVAQMAVIGWGLEKEGYIVLGLHLLPASYTDQADHQAEHEGIKEQMDALHLRKIELADQVLVCNINGYIGNSTRREIAHAERLGRPVRYLEDL